MDFFGFGFKTTAVLHSIVGLFSFAIAANEEVQEWLVYGNRNPLAGDVFKYLIYAYCWLLMGCGIAAFLIPGFAVVLACGAFGFYLLTGIVDLVGNRRWPTFSKVRSISIATRVAGVALLTYFYVRMRA